LPPNLLSFVLSFGKWHQVAMVTLSVALFALGTAPLEVQRRIVNASTTTGSFSSIALLVVVYLALTCSEGLIKVVFNLYTSWIGERAIQWLRLFVLRKSEQGDVLLPRLANEAIQLSIVLEEAEPVGGFVGACFTQPILQIGILAGVCGYLFYLQPLMALIVAVIFLPQVGFVPLMQRAINKRVEKRIIVTRDLSQEIIDTSGDAAAAVSPIGIGELFATNMSIYKFKFSMNFSMNLMTQLGYAGIFALGGYYVVTGKTQIGTVVAFISGLAKINDPWSELVDWYRNFKVTQVKYQLIRSIT
jgi:ABC-type bacteriocin/lantibiotic exporter with double-glycine peptidase domain